MNQKNLKIVNDVLEKYPYRYVDRIKKGRSVQARLSDVDHKLFCKLADKVVDLGADMFNRYRYHFYTEGIKIKH